MARRLRASRLETRTTRLKLPVRLKPYDFTTLSPGIALGYRRNVGGGTWVLRAADGHGGNWTRRVALADDFEDADGEHVLTFWQAQERTRKLARGSADDAGRPTTVADAVDAYRRDLTARGGDVANATRIRRHLTPSLATKPVGLLSARDLAAWRDGLLAGGKLKRASVLRLFKAFKAALNLSARRDPRIRNEKAWRDGLSGLTNTFATRNAQVLSDAQVHAVIVAAYAENEPFGRYIETAAITGARLSQITRLNVADLQDGTEPRLLLPGSRKGNGRRAVGKRPIPITVPLAAKLKVGAAGRAPDAPLLLRADGRRWQTAEKGDHSRSFAKAAMAAGAVIDGKPVTAYALRHSSIVRALLAGVPARVVAATHDTSVIELERTYSAYITDHADAVARRGLIASPSPPADNVVSMAGRRP
jgi:integrase